MSLSDSEIQSLRFHLGYGNISSGAYPFTPDGFLELFEGTVSPNLQDGAETTASTAVTAGTTTTVTVGDITDIVPWGELVVDVADDAEVVVVKSVSGSTFTASFAKSHVASGYPVAVMSGVARMRMLLWDAGAAWKKAQSSSITKTAGLKQLGKGEIEWFPGGSVLSDTMAHYRSIVWSISALVRVRPAWADEDCSGVTLSAY